MKRNNLHGGLVAAFRRREITLFQVRSILDRRTLGALAVETVNTADQASIYGN